MAEIIYAVVMSFLIPIIMIACGYWMWKKPPRNINSMFGYRTMRSMKNQDTWDFAHEYGGRLWYRWGWGLLIFTGVCLLIATELEQVSYTVVMLIFVILQTIFLCATIYPIERTLAHTFDKDGNRINDEGGED